MLPPGTRIYLCTEPCDMRRGFDSLLAEAKRRCHSDPFTGHLFIFVGKRKCGCKRECIWDNSSIRSIKTV